MVKWRYCLFLAVLLLLPSSTLSKSEEDDDDERNDDDDNDDEDNEEDYEAEEQGGDKAGQGVGRRSPDLLLQTTRSVTVTRTTKKRPLECYVCAYKSDTSLRACLDPTKFRVHTMTCHSLEDKCFTSVTTKGNSYEAVVRGCRSACIGSPEITCCELNRCNHQAFAMPTLVAPHTLVQEENKATKALHPSVLFFVTILLVLQTVVKVAFV